MLDAGVVDQDVGATKGPFDVGDHLGDLLRIGHVRRVVADSRAMAAKLGKHAFDVAEAIDHHCGTGRGQTVGDAQADAAGGAGDQCDLAFEIHVGFSCR